MNQSLKFYFVVFIGALILMFDAFFNGFPIVYSDTSTFISSGFELQTPFDRPITYGLFLRIFSFNGLSLWFVVFAQALIVSYLIFLLIKTFTNQNVFLKLGLFTILFFTLFTGLSWTVCQLIPDIFTSVALICLILILIGKFERGTFIFLYFLFTFSIAMHISHILMFILILIVIYLFRKFILNKRELPSGNKQILILLVLTTFCVLTMGSAISKSKHVFFMGAMVEHGIVKKYLDDNCNNNQFKLCAYKDSLPTKAYQFVWDEKSPLYKIGGWKESKKEFDQIISATLTEPKYILLHIEESCKATFSQLIQFNIGEGNGSFLNGTKLFERISLYCNNDLKTYSSSKQNLSKLSFIIIWNYVFVIIIVISLLILIYLLITKKIVTTNLKTAIVIVLLGIIINAWDCGTFANAIERLGCKMIWLIPLLSSLAIFQLRYKGKENKL